jgi:hypothetical protein
MRFRGLDSDGDWMLGQGDGSYAKDEDAVALSIATRLRSVYGNCFFDPEFGVDYLTRMNPGREIDLVNDMLAMLQQTDGVVTVESFSHSLNRTTRKLSVRYTVTTIYGIKFERSIDNVAGVL